MDASRIQVSRWKLTEACRQQTLGRPLKEMSPKEFDSCWEVPTMWPPPDRQALSSPRNKNA